MTAHNLSLRMADDPPTLPPLAPAATVCGNCAAWNGFGSGAGGRCGDARSPRTGNVIARSTAGCPLFCRCGTQLSLMV